MFKFLVKFSYLILLSSVHSRCKFKALLGHCIFQMSSSSFPYNWYNVIHVINKINYTINYEESKCDLCIYTAYHNHPFIVQKEISNVFKSAPNYMEKGNGYMSKTNLVLILTTKRRRKSSYSQFLTQTD